MSYVLVKKIGERVLDLSPQAKATLEHLAQYADNDGRRIFVSAQRLALERGLSVRAIERHIRELRAAGWLLDDGWVSHRPPVKLRRIPAERLDAYPLARDLMAHKPTYVSVCDEPTHMSARAPQTDISDTHKPTKATPQTDTYVGLIDPYSIKDLIRERETLKDDDDTSPSQKKSELSDEQRAAQHAAFMHELENVGVVK